MYNKEYYDGKKNEVAKKFQGHKDALIQQMIQLVAGYVNQQKLARDEFKKITDAEEISKNPEAKEQADEEFNTSQVEGKEEVKKEKKDEKEHL